LKGNKYPPAFTNEMALSFNITSLKNTNIKLPSIKDKDEDPYKIVKYT